MLRNKFAPTQILLVSLNSSDSQNYMTHTISLVTLANKKLRANTMLNYSFNNNNKKTHFCK